MRRATVALAPALALSLALVATGLGCAPTAVVAPPVPPPLDTRGCVAARSHDQAERLRPLCLQALRELQDRDEVPLELRATLLESLAAAHAWLGDFDDAEGRLLRALVFRAQALALPRRTPPVVDEAAALAFAEDQLVRLYSAWGQARHDEAILRRAEEWIDQKLRSRPSALSVILDALARVQIEKRRFEAAELSLDRSDEVLAGMSRQSLRARQLYRRAQLYRGQKSGRAESAYLAAQRAAEALSDGGEPRPELLLVLLGRAHYYEERGDSDAALRLREQAAALLRRMPLRSMSTTAPDGFDAELEAALRELGAGLKSHGAFAEAELCLSRLASLVQIRAGLRSLESARALARLVDLHLESGQPGRAESLITVAVQLFPRGRSEHPEALRLVRRYSRALLARRGN